MLLNSCSTAFSFCLIAVVPRLRLANVVGGIGNILTGVAPDSISTSEVGISPASAVSTYVLLTSAEAFPISIEPLEALRLSSSLAT